MRKSFITINAIALSAMLLLSGCSESAIDMEKVERIGDNFNKIYENISSIDTQKISDNVDKTAEAANEIGEWVEEEVIEEVVSEAAEEVTEAEEAEDVFDENITLLDILDEEAVVEIIVEPLISQITSYTQEGDEVLKKAYEMKENGLAKVQEGLDLLDEVKNSKTEISDKVIEKMIKGSRLLVEGSNEVSEGTNIIINETAKTANEIIAQAELLGIKSEELDKLKETLLQAQKVELYTFSDDVIEKLDEAEEMLELYRVISEADVTDIDIDFSVDLEEIQKQLESIPKYAEDAKNIVGTANEAVKYTQNLYKDIESSSKVVVDTAKEIVKDQNMEVAEDALKTYDAVGEYLEAIPTKELTKIEKELDKVVEITKGIDFGSIFGGIFK